MPTQGEDAGRPSVDQTNRRSASISDSPSRQDVDAKPTRPSHQRLVFPDPVALRYLEEDPATTVIDRRRQLLGYEMYLVEQWACSRSHPTFIIATYTGDMTQSILAGVLSVPTDESTWSSRLKVYFQAIQQFHARKRETPLGTIMVTNLSSFPSALTVIAVPDGDMKKHREDFFVNENLKRMGCSGRAGLNLQPPPQSTQAKYYHVYHTSEKVPLYTSVMELVKLCQLALVIFDKLKLAYADGLLCDVTEQALTDWWSDIGTDMYNLEPSDGILGPTTVSALIGLLMGSHNRLKVTGAPVTKDPFEVDTTKRAISSFQKAHKLSRTRRLDRQTIEKLQRVTAKAASGEGWIVPRAVKSTVAELSGKGGEMVMGMVGAREKAGISDIETLDIERLSQLVTGSRARWLWQGKPIKSGSTDLSKSSEDQKDIIFSRDDRGGFIWTTRRHDNGTPGNLERIVTSRSTDQSPSWVDQRSGFDRLKDKVGIPGSRNHHHYSHHQRQHSRDPGERSTDKVVGRRSEEDGASPNLTRQVTEMSLKGDEVVPSEKTNGQGSRQSLVREGKADYLSPDIVISRAEVDQSGSVSDDGSKPASKPLEQEKSVRFAEKYRDLPPLFDTQEPDSLYLRRSRSAVQLRGWAVDTAKTNKLPRLMSFSALENSLSRGDEVTENESEAPMTATPDPIAQVAQLRLQAAKKQEFSQKILFLDRGLVPWTMMNVELVDDLEEMCQGQIQELNNLYREHLDDFLTLKTHSTELLDEERMRLNEDVKRIDVLGAKLDYELNALESRIEDVEDGVADFEKSIVDIEKRISNLVSREPPRPSWFSWLRGTPGEEK